MRATSNEKPAAGFTLIEVLVALAIAALGLGFLMAATGTGLQNSTSADEYIQAVGRAQSRLAQVGITIPLRQGDFSGDDGGGFRWQVHIDAPAVHGGDGPQGAPLNLYPVQATIHWRSGFSQRTYTLRTERTANR